MLPLRFKVIPPDISSFLHKRFERPPINEITRWIFQPRKEKRAAKIIGSKVIGDEFVELQLKGIQKKFYYPASASWVDLCQTIDECLNPDNWHYFITSKTPIGPDDVVIDCGAAEGLFSVVAAESAKMVYAVEPMPVWEKSLNKTFNQYENIKHMACGVGHKNAVMRMSDCEIYSRICHDGELAIPIRTLDSLFHEKGIAVSFIKADVEGFEFQMLLGAEDLIKANRPKISLTVYHPTNCHREIIEFLSNIHPDYKFNLRGISSNGNPVLLQAY